MYKEIKNYEKKNNKTTVQLYRNRKSRDRLNWTIGWLNEIQTKLSLVRLLKQRGSERNNNENKRF